MTVNLVVQADPLGSFFRVRFCEGSAGGASAEGRQVANVGISEKERKKGQARACPNVSELHAKPQIDLAPECSDIAALRKPRLGEGGCPKVGLAEARRTDIRDREELMRSVGQVVSLATQLEVETVHDAEVLEQRHIVVPEVRSAELAARQIAEAGSWRNERGT